MLNFRSYIADKRKAAPGQKDALQPTNRIGRPPAKHSPDYQQMSVYIHNDVRRKVKVRLFETGGEFSACVESLLRECLLNHESREERRMILSSSPLTRLDLLHDQLSQFSYPSLAKFLSLVRVAVPNPSQEIASSYQSPPLELADERS
jgi:hypothetical protein